MEEKVWIEVWESLGGGLNSKGSSKKFHGQITYICSKTYSFAHWFNYLFVQSANLKCRAVFYLLYSSERKLTQPSLSTPPQKTFKDLKVDFFTQVWYIITYFYSEIIGLIRVTTYLYLYLTLREKADTIITFHSTPP